MKAIFITGLLFLITTFSIKAQVAPALSLTNYEQLAQQATSIMLRNLSLSTTQADSVALINKDYYLKTAGLQNQKMAPEQKQQQRQLAESYWKSRLHNTLTETQYNQYFDLVNANWQRVHHRIDSLNTAHQKH